MAKTSGDIEAALIERARENFKQSYLRGEAPVIEHYLDFVQLARVKHARLITGLVFEELSLLWDAGIKGEPEHYAHRFPKVKNLEHIVASWLQAREQEPDEPVDDEDPFAGL